MVLCAALLQQKVRVSNTARGIFHFSSSCVFIKVFIFVQQKGRTLTSRHAFAPLALIH